EVATAAWYIHEHLPERKIVLGVDRLDYTKGIPERLEAFRLTLQRYPELQEKIVLVQVVVPSRREIPQYVQLKEEIERLVGEINGQFTRSGWVPIHYIFRNLQRLELVAYYRTAEIALITPLKDGMNLVAKEYCASKVEEDGVVILSEFAGAAAQFQRGALLVNPHDVVGVAEAIYEAYTMSPEERRRRMRRLRQAIRRYNIFWWVDAFLQAAIARRLDTFPVLMDYIPTEG
ncbi:MAG TPA: trehalose-6-phosphate synthase, partial [Bacteroidetes bacterium]|nr:trehalose-6-phosphate synthase [Bacteroidota bacterium]